MARHPLPTKEQCLEEWVRGRVHTLRLVPLSLLLTHDWNQWQTGIPDTISGLCFRLEVAIATQLGETLWFYFLFTRSHKFQAGHQNEIYYLHSSLAKSNIHHSTITRQFKTKSKPESPPKPGLWKYEKATSIFSKRYDCVVKRRIWPHSVLSQSCQYLFVVTCTPMTLSTVETVHWTCPKSIDLDSSPVWELGKTHIFNLQISSGLNSMQKNPNVIC